MPVADYHWNTAKQLKSGAVDHASHFGKHGKFVAILRLHNKDYLVELWDDSAESTKFYSSKLSTAREIFSEFVDSRFFPTAKCRASGWLKYI